VPTAARTMINRLRTFILIPNFTELAWHNLKDTLYRA